MVKGWTDGRTDRAGGGNHKATMRRGAGARGETGDGGGRGQRKDGRGKKKTARETASGLPARACGSVSVNLSQPNAGACIPLPPAQHPAPHPWPPTLHPTRIPCPVVRRRFLKNLANLCRENATLPDVLGDEIRGRKKSTGSIIHISS